MLRPVLFAILVQVAPPCGATADPAAAMLKTMELLAARQAQSHPLEARALEKRLAEFGPGLRRLGPAALPALSAYLADGGRPLKVRLYAAAFLGLLRDPGGLGVLRERAFDPAEDPGLRSAALQAVGSLAIAPPALRPILDRAVALPGAPPPLWREALAQLAWIGTGAVPAVLARAKSAGAAPAGLDRGAAALALQALARSPDAAATGALLGLLDFYRPDSPLIPRTLDALERRLRPGGLRRGDMERLERILARGRGEAAVRAARLLALSDGRRVGAALLRALDVSDPAVVAAAAEALARQGRPEGAPAVRRLNEGVAEDGRFAPAPGRPDPREYARQIQRAQDFYGRFAARSSVPGPAAPSATSTAVVAIAAAATEPFRYSGWPGRGRPRLAWNGSTPALRLRAAPERAAEVSAEARLPAGAPVAFSDSVVITRSPGRVRARRRVELNARDLGEAPRLSADEIAVRGLAARLALERGDALEVLAYRSEGECLARRERRVYLLACPQDDREAFIRQEEAVTEWWLRAESSEGSGWFSSEEPGLDFLSRD